MDHWMHKCYLLQKHLVGLVPIKPALYHPSQQACNIHRNLTKQQEDFRILRNLLANS